MKQRDFEPEDYDNYYGEADPEGSSFVDHMINRALVAMVALSVVLAALIAAALLRKPAPRAESEPEPPLEPASYFIHSSGGYDPASDGVHPVAGPGER